MIDTINKFIDDFVTKFTISFEKEQKFLVGMMKNDFDKSYDELKIHLQQKVEKLMIYS